MALPQYQVAVGKSKLARVKVAARALAEAEEVYYLANNAYTNLIENLDISFADCSGASCVISNDGNICYLSINGESGTRHRVECYAGVGTAKVGYEMILPRSTSEDSGRTTCYAYDIENTNSVANKICKSDTGLSTNTRQYTSEEWPDWLAYDYPN